MRKLITFWMFLTLFKSFAQLPSYVPSTGLIGWYPFNGNADDISGNGNNGTVLTGTILATDRFGKIDSCYVVDGLNCPDPKGVSLPVQIDNTGSYTISAWYQSLDSTKQDQTIFNSSPHQFIGVNLNYPFSGFENKTCSFIGDGSSWPITGATCNWETYFLHDWHHIVAAKNSTEIKFYQDGVLVFTQAISPGINVGSFDLVVGAISINGGSQCYETLQGKIDDIGIWNYEMNIQEITDLWNSCQMEFTLQPSNQTEYTSNNVQLSCLNMSGCGYQWQSDFGAGFVDLSDIGQYSGTNTDTLTILNLTMGNHNQDFRCIATYDNCKDTSMNANLTVIDASALIENYNHTLDIYPNPVDRALNIRIGGLCSDIPYTITDFSGKLVLSGIISNEHEQIDMTGITPGVYCLHVVGDYKLESEFDQILIVKI